MRGDFCWYWWNCWPSLNELKWEVIFVEWVDIERWFLDIVELLTITEWVKVRWLLLILVEWWFLLILVELLTITQSFRRDERWIVDHHWVVNFVDIGGIVDHHSKFWDRGVIFVDIGGIVDHHSMSWSERWRWFLLILVELLTITQWVEVRGDFCCYWWNCWPSLNELKWDVMFVDIGEFVEFRWEVIFVDISGIESLNELTMTYDCCWYWWNYWPSLNLGERWFLLILVELLTITQWIEVRGDFRLVVMSWIEGFLLILVVELLTITQWVEVRGDVCWYWWNCWPSLNELRWEVIFVDIGGWYWLWNCWPSVEVRGHVCW